MTSESEKAVTLGGIPGIMDPIIPPPPPPVKSPLVFPPREMRSGIDMFAA